MIRNKQELRKIILSEIKKIKENEETVLELSGVDGNEYYISPKDIKYIAPADTDGFYGLARPEHFSFDSEESDHSVFLIKPKGEIMGTGKFSGGDSIIARDYKFV